MRNFATITVSSVLIAAAAAAHPGHGGSAEAYGIVHHLTEPFHVVGALGVVLVALTGVHLLRGRRASSVRHR